MPGRGVFSHGRPQMCGPFDGGKNAGVFRRTVLVSSAGKSTSSCARRVPMVVLAACMAAGSCSCGPALTPALARNSQRKELLSLPGVLRTSEVAMM